MTHRNLLSLVLVTALMLVLHPSTSPAQEEAEAPPSDLVVETVREGEGDAVAAGDTAFVHYTGWLYAEGVEENKGPQFDSSRPRGMPIPFTLGAGQVIAGWEQGVEGMHIGERRRLTIPPDLAYGERGFGDGVIPPGATLIFEVELMRIE